MQSYDNTTRLLGVRLRLLGATLGRVSLKLIERSAARRARFCAQAEEEAADAEEGDDDTTSSVRMLALHALVVNPAPLLAAAMVVVSDRPQQDAADWKKHEVRFFVSTPCFDCSCCCCVVSFEIAVIQI